MCLGSEPRPVLTFNKHQTDTLVGPCVRISHLDQLEADSIHIMREVVAEAERPVLLYSVGKDSSVLLHLALKAFFPSPLPFPVLHVASGWDFPQVIAHRDETAKRHGLDLRVEQNAEAAARGIDPFATPTAIYVEEMLIRPLKVALARHRFDAAFGGARRDEEKSRAKERVFSLRSENQRWDPRKQRPELWNLYNTKRRPGESLRVFPLSNWTELDVWHYILREQIALVSLYFSAPRPVIDREGALVMVADQRMPLTTTQSVELRHVRFRTVGCYPLTAALESAAKTVEEVIAETLNARTSERSGRLVDHDQPASMERKKEAGYF